MTAVVTGSASGIGAATCAQLVAQGERVIGVDVRDADVIADLSTKGGRAAAVDGVTAMAGDSLDALVTCAGLGPVPSRAGSAIVAVNYFGTVELMRGLRPLLARGTSPAAVAISSNSTTCSPGVPADLIELCLAGDEATARARADEIPTMHGVYPASKLAVARWIRAAAVSKDWIGAGIRLNAVAPGMIETAMIAEGRADATVGPLLDLFPIPMGRPGRPEEIAGLISWLLGEAASLLVGSIVFADGGTDALLRTNDWPAAWEVDLPAS
ncbi:MAG TPA: SDR family oxidoreductase [Acidimicrobiales bacterium]|nr:SDR family oxidoreductase [Acidimicrobiales bacterium]